eukprot:GILI01017180.1.p1 GENE.GILI01017180.1~~GILI01017180.1.p1  ORF type:complete len:919 (-),score=101.24 GILI01017180.1:69-2525(-)
MNEFLDTEEHTWKQLMVDTEPMRVMLARVNSSYGDVRRRLLYAEEDGRMFIEADQQKLATISALVVASLGAACPTGTELCTVYPHVAPNVCHGDGSNNVHYLLSVIDSFHTNPSAVGFLKVASTLWSTKDYTTSRLLGSDGGVTRCKQMLQSFIGMEDVVSSVISTVASISTIRANNARLCRSFILRDIVSVMSVYMQGGSIQIASAKALASLAPLDPSLLSRCASGMETLLESYGHFSHNPFYCLDVLSVLSAVTLAAPQSHMMVATSGLPIIGATLLRRYPGDWEMLRHFLDICVNVSTNQPIRAVMVSGRWAPRVACQVLKTPSAPIALRHKAINALRKLAGNVMGKSSIILSAYVAPLLADCIATEGDERVKEELHTLRKRLLLKHDSQSINRDGSHVPVPKGEIDQFMPLLPPSLASSLVPMEALRFQSRPTALPPCQYGLSSHCLYTCPSTGVEVEAEARVLGGLSQFLLADASSPASSDQDAGLQMAAMAMLVADVQNSNNPPLPFIGRCLGLAVGSSGPGRVFCGIFSSELPQGSVLLKDYTAILRRMADKSGQARLVSIPIVTFVAIAESIFEALVMMRNLQIKHQGIDYESLWINGDLPQGNVDFGVFDIPQHLGWSVDPLTCSITPASYCCLDWPPTVDYEREEPATNPMDSASLSITSLPPIVIYLQTPKLLTGPMLDEVAAALPSDNNQCLLSHETLRAIRDENRVYGAGYEADATAGRLLLLRLLAFGAPISHSSLLEYTTKANGVDGERQKSSNALQIHWLLEKLPKEVKHILFDTTSNGLFRHDISETWEELARIRRRLQQM